MNKIVVVTGGTRGIGRALTEGFLAAGYSIVVGARQSLDIEDLDRERIKFVEMDVRNEADHVKLTKAAADLGELKAYVNNAGFSAWFPIDLVTDAFFDNMIATNLKGAFWGCKAAAAALGDGGSIINISSMAAKRGSANNSVYCATKFGMNGLTQSLAKELGPRGIRVNAICPVLVRTDGLVDALQSEHSPAKGDPEKFLENFKDAQAALNHLPTGNEIANYAVWLTSDMASAMTGQCVNVDCGVFPQ
jgi:NAD(P)-dependent dehydrogenase (short-subunit alcohol dehydrogenase family)